MSGYVTQVGKDGYTLEDEENDRIDIVYDTLVQEKKWEVFNFLKAEYPEEFI